jgi:hypothetical protein
MRHGVLIVECIDASDPGSEGRVLREVFKLMEVESSLVRVESIADLVTAMVKTDFEHIHVATHGAVTREEQFSGWWTPDGHGTRPILEKQQFSLACTSIVSTACKSGSKGFARHVTESWGSKYFIAPTGSPRFYNSALFSHIYYHKLFKTKKTVPKAFASYEKGYKNPHGFAIYKRCET